MSFCVHLHDQLVMHSMSGHCHSPWPHRAISRNFHLFFSHLGMETLLTFSVDNQLWNFDIKLVIPSIARVLEHQESSMLILGKNEDGVLGYAEPFLWFDRCIQCPWDIASRNCPMAVKNVSSITFRFEWNHLTCNGHRGTHHPISWWWRKHLLPSQGQSPTNDTLDTLSMFGTILDTL